MTKHKKIHKCGTRKIAPYPNPKPNPNSNAGGFAGAQSSGGNFPVTHRCTFRLNLLGQISTVLNFCDS